MSLFFTALSVASSVTQAFAARQQAAAMKAYYDSQADISRLQYESKRVEAREQGVQVLKAVNQAMGSALAQAAAGGILATEGSALLGQTNSFKEGIRDFRMANLNQELLQNMSELEYNNLRQAGIIKAEIGTIDALAGLGTDLVDIERRGLFEPAKNLFTRKKAEE